MKCLPGIERAPASFLASLKQVSKEKGWDYPALLTHIAHESKFNPAAKNPNSSSVGLIQMLDSVSRKFAGVPSAQLATMSHDEQLPGIVRYFDVGKPLKGADFLLLGVSRNPALVGASDSRVLFRADSEAARVNPGLQDSTGAITVGGLRKHFAAYQRAHSCPGVEKNASFGGVSLLAVGIVSLVAFKRLRGR